MIELAREVLKFMNLLPRDLKKEIWNNLQYNDLIAAYPSDGYILKRLWRDFSWSKVEIDVAKKLLKKITPLQLYSLLSPHKDATSLLIYPYNWSNKILNGIKKWTPKEILHFIKVVYKDPGYISKDLLIMLRNIYLGTKSVAQLYVEFIANQKIVGPYVRLIYLFGSNCQAFSDLSDYLLTQAIKNNLLYFILQKIEEDHSPEPDYPSY